MIFSDAGQVSLVKIWFFDVDGLVLVRSLEMRHLGLIISTCMSDGGHLFIVAIASRIRLLQFLFLSPLYLE